MEDTYTPDPLDSAQCPRCGAVQEHVYSLNPTIQRAWVSMRCPGCEIAWHETRQGADRNRYWDGAAS